MKTQKRKYILSASRRTDCVASDPTRLARILRGEFPFARGLKETPVHTLLVSTKDPRNLLDHTDFRQACARCEQICINMTVTGLGGTALEPAVPTWSELRPRMAELAEMIGDPRRITWCFDPILTWAELSNADPQLFRYIAEPLADLGILRLFAMFYRPYSNSRIAVDPLAPEKASDFATELDSIARECQLELSFCHVPGFHRHKCVDLDWLAELHPDQDTSPLAHYKRIKKADTNYCRDAIWDIGWYLPACKHGCRYCYSAPAAGAECDKLARSSQAPDHDHG